MRRDPLQEQGASGPPEAHDTEAGRVGTPAYDTGAGRVGTRYRSRASPAEETTKSTERGDTYTSREHKQFAMGYRCTVKGMTIRKNSMIRIDCFQLIGLVWVALAYTTKNECLRKRGHAQPNDILDNTRAERPSGTHDAYTVLHARSNGSGEYGRFTAPGRARQIQAHNSAASLLLIVRRYFMNDVGYVLPMAAPRMPAEPYANQIPTLLQI